MLGMLLPSTIPGAPNTWKVWVDYIMKRKQELNLKKCAMVYSTGAIASGTSGFSLSAQDFHRIKTIFENPEKYEKVIVGGKTYVIKSASTSQIVAFNGAKYYIISKSKSMYIFTMCESRLKSDDASIFIGKMAAKLVAKDY